MARMSRLGSWYGGSAPSTADALSLSDSSAGASTACSPESAPYAPEPAPRASVWEGAAGGAGGSGFSAIGAHGSEAPSSSDGTAAVSLSDASVCSAGGIGGVGGIANDVTVAGTMPDGMTWVVPRSSSNDVSAA